MNLAANLGPSFLGGTTVCLVSFAPGFVTAVGLLVFGTAELAGTARGFGALSFAAGFFTGWTFEAGCGASGLSEVFAADEVVGRIILARKESGAAAFCDGRFCWEGCFFKAAGGGPKDVRPLDLLVRLGDRD